MLSSRTLSLLFACRIVSLFAPSAQAQERRPPSSLAELQQRMLEQISQPKFDGAFWGVQVASLDTGKVLFEHNAGKLFSPASNSKLYTVALALDRLGPEYRIKTSLFSQTKPNRRGTLKGDLIIYGRGDPTHNGRLHDHDIFQALEPLVSALTNAGVKRVEGDLVADQSFFHGPALGSGWMWDDLEYGYGAEISALTIDDNILQVTVQPGNRTGQHCRLAVLGPPDFFSFSNRTETVVPAERQNLYFFRMLDSNILHVSGRMPLGSATYTNEVPVHNPAGLFLATFKEALARQHIKIRGKLRTVDWQDRVREPLDYGKMVELGAIESPLLRDIAREVQKPSQNLYADLLLAQVGESFRPPIAPPDATSEEMGIRELDKFLTESGVAAGDRFFEEGSGLSRDNLTTPRATVTLLSYMSRHRAAEAYLSALPIAGVDGTLRNRMKGTVAAGNVRAKTGSLRWTSSLSGYVTTSSGEHLAFSMMLNRYHNLGTSQPAGRVDLDALAILLAGFTGRSTN